MKPRLIAAVGALCLLASVASASSDAERRAHTGVRIFRALLAADLALEEKALDNGELLVAVYYSADRDWAESLAAQIRGADAPTAVRGLAVRTVVTDDPGFASLGAGEPAAVFIAEEPDARALDRLVAYGIERHVIVYSPFEGHVERGVTGGLAIEAQVRPYVNTATLDAAGIQLKSFFLKVTKAYGDG